MAPCLKRDAGGQDVFVVVSVELRDGDLLTGADGEAEAILDGESAEDDAGSQKDLSFGVVGSLGKVRVVDFDFGPDFAKNSVLGNGIPDDLAADDVGIGHGEDGAESGSEIEIAPALACGEGGRDGGVLGAVGVRACGKRAAEKGGEDVIVMLFVGGKDTIFQQVGEVAETVVLIAISASNIGRRIEEQFDITGRDDFYALGAAVVVEVRGAVRLNLAGHVIAEFLLEARGNGDDRSDPMGLLVLRGCDHGEPTMEEIIAGRLRSKSPRIGRGGGGISDGITGRLLRAAGRGKRQTQQYRQRKKKDQTARHWSWTFYRYPVLLNVAYSPL